MIVHPIKGNDMKISVGIKDDNTKKVLELSQEAIDRALKRMGIAATGYAQDMTPVDTGLARNSITWALHGQEPELKSYKSNTTNKKGQTVQQREGSYEGGAPEEKNTVFIGSNVEYFPALEDGDSGHKAWHMLRNAIQNNSDVYRGFLEDELKREQEPE